MAAFFRSRSRWPSLLAAALAAGMGCRAAKPVAPPVAELPGQLAVFGRSPLAHARDVTVPVLLVHGRDDTVVPYEQSQLMADALKAAGKPVELITLEGEDHWLSRSATRLLMLEHVLAFLKANNPPDGS